MFVYSFALKCIVCITKVNTTQDNVIRLAPPVNGLSIFQDWLDRMKLVSNINVASGKNMLADMFKISIWSTNLDTGQIRSNLTVAFAFPLSLITK